MNNIGINQAVNGNAIGNFFKEYGITGNPYFDGIIFANLIPIVLSYVKFVANFSKDVFMDLLTYFIGRGRIFIKNRFRGNVLCKMIINEESKVYNNIRKLVFDPDIKSDLNPAILANISKFTKRFKHNIHYTDFREKREREVKLDLDTSGNQLFSYESHFYSAFDNLETKVFKYLIPSKDDLISSKFDEVIIVFTLKEKENKENRSSEDAHSHNVYHHVPKGSRITIKVISFNQKRGPDKGKKKVPKKEYVQMIEEFLRSKFDFSDNYYYAYSADITDKNIIDAIKGIDNVLGTRSGTNSEWWAIGDERPPHFVWGIKTTEKNDEDLLCPLNSIVKFKHKNINNLDYEQKIQALELISAKDSVSLFNDNFAGLYSKYVGLYPKDGMYSKKYYFNNERLIMCYKKNQSSYYRVTTVSKGQKLTSKSFKREIIGILDCYKKGVGNLNVQAKPTKKQVRIYKRSNGQWGTYLLDKRSFETIYLPDKIMESIRFEIDNFLEIEKLYQEFQIPYKKGLLFHGPPGTGKTSLVKALAFEYQLPIYLLNVNDDEINDDSIVDILNEIGGSKKILLFEDIDTAFADKEAVKSATKVIEVANSTSKDDNSQKNDKEITTDHVKTVENVAKNISQQVQPGKTKFLTYSGLLNALDGVMSNQSGVITIMTTNYKERLGKAFLRPGRIDKSFELRECNAEQLEKMTRIFIDKRTKIFKELLKKNNSSKLKEEETKFNEEFLNEKIAEFVDRLTDDYGMARNMIRPCEMQFYLLKYIENVDDLFNNYQELLEKKHDA